MAGLFDLIDRTDRRRLKFYALLPAVLWAAAPALAADEKAEKVTYQDHVLPLFRNSCLGCHNPDKKKAGLDLSTYQAALTGSDNGAVIAPGDAGNSKLFKLVTHAEEPTMPPKKDKLPDKELEVIRLWIANGALETANGKIAVVARPKVDLSTVASVARPTGTVAMPRGLSGDPVVRTQRPGAVVSLAASPWAPLLAVGGQRQILLYHSQTLELLGVLPFPEGLPHVLTFSRNGSLLLAGGGVEGKSGKVVLFDVATGNRAAEVGDEFDAVLAADITGDQSVVVLGGPNRLVKGYAVADGKLLYTIKKHTDWVTAVACSADGQLIASADRAGGIGVWEAKTGHEVFTLAGHKESVSCLAFRDDSMVLASSSTDGTVKLWSMDDGKEIKSWAAHGNYRPPAAAVGAGTFDPAVGTLSVAFTHDGRLVTCGRDKVVKVWSPTGGQLKALAPPFADVALHATFDDDGTRVVAGDWTGQLRVWNVADGKVLGDLRLDPPTITERLETAVKKLADAQPAADKLIADARSADEAARKLAEEVEKTPALLEQAKKAIADAEAGMKAATAMVATATEHQKMAGPAVDAAQKEVVRLAALTQSGSVATADVKPLESAVAEKQASLDQAEKRLKSATEAAAKHPDDAPAKAEVEAARASLARRTQRLADAKKALEAAGPAKPSEDRPSDGAVKAAEDAAQAAKKAAVEADKALDDARAQVKASEQSLAAMKEQVRQLEKSLTDKTEASKAAAAKAAAAKASADTAVGQLKELQYGVAKLKAGGAASALAAARKMMTEREAEQSAAADAVKAAQAAADKAVADAAAFEKALPEAPKRLKMTQEAVDKAAKAAVAAKSAADAAVEEQKQREALSQQSVDLSQKIAVAAAQSKDNKALADAAKGAKSTADLLAADVTAVKQVASAKADEAKKAAEAQTATEAEMAKAKAEAENGPKLLADLKKAAEAAAAEVPKKKSAAEVAAKPVAEAKAKVDGLKADYDKLDREAQQLATPANGPETKPAKPS